MITTLLACILFASCEVTGIDNTRRLIIDEQKKVMVRVMLDWSRAELETETPDGRVMGSVWFFPEDGGEPSTLNTDETLDSIPLLPGAYRILAFNGLLSPDTRSNELVSSSFRYIGFRGTKSYDTFEAYCRNPLELMPRFAPSLSKDAPTSSPEALAVDHYRSGTRDGNMDEATSDGVFRVTAEMANQGIRPTLEFIPRRITSSIHLTVHVENLANAASQGGANVASISGLAGSILLSTGDPKPNPPTPTTHYFTINHRKYYEDSATNGTVEGFCYTFGMAPEDAAGNDGNPTYQVLDIYFTLRDGAQYEKITRDITGRFSKNEQTLQAILEITVGAKRLGEDDIIRLPETQDPGGDGSAFDPDVLEWGENVVFPLEI
jgi:hypothetical protein